MLYHVIHEDLEDEEGAMIISKKTYSLFEASEKAEVLSEKYPNCYADIISVEDHQKYGG